jgi:predicted nucleic acid-binding protein
VAYYLDTSALAKLIVPEAETDALRAWLAAEERHAIACELVRPELLRAVRRVQPDHDLRAWTVLELVTLVEVTRDTWFRAATIGTPSLRTLDAVHLAAALDLGSDLEGMVTYDQRLADAARECGIRVIVPV